MVAAFAVLGVALDTQTDIVEVNRKVADSGLKKQQEKFVINNILQLSGQPLQVNATNLGQNPSEMFTLVMTNSSDVTGGFPTTTVEIPSDTSFLPPNSDSSTNIVGTLNLKMKNADPGETDTYNFKVISSLGTIEKMTVVCDDVGICNPAGGGGTGSLAAQLFLDGPNGVNTKTSTVIMFVSNTGDIPLQNVQPIDTCADMLISIVPFDGPEEFDPCTLEPVGGQDLAVGQTKLFKWDGVVTGDIDDVFTFCNGVSGEELDSTPVPNSNIDCDTLTIIDPNDCGGCGPGGEGGETIILIDDLLIRPSIFMVIPSPMGDASDGAPGTVDKVMFGVNVVNPTNSTIDVSKVVMSVFAPGANNNDRLFKVSGSGCEAENISPLGPGYSDADWDCPGENQLLWKNRANPVNLTPYSVETFMTKIIIGGTGIDLEGILIQTSVFTSFGSFGKGNYQTTMTVPHSPTLSMYMSPNVDSLADADRLANRQDIVHNVTQNFNIVLADTDLDDQTWLETGARFIINVPREWTGVNVTGSTGVIANATQPSVELFSDGSTQIIGLTDELIGNCDSDPCDPGERRAATISFEALPPNKEIDRLYIMYVLADGEAWTRSDYLFDSGPLNEIVLQVNSNSTGP